MIQATIKVKDFTGQNIYVGMDVHYKSWSVSIYSEEFELKTFSQPPDVKKLSDYLRAHYPGADYHLAYEAGFCVFWIQRAFAQEGINCSVIHPADVPGSDKELKRKTDSIDSRKIARGIKNKELNAVYVPDEQLEADRLLLRTRNMLVHDITGVKNRIKAFLKIKGIVVPDRFKTGTWTNRFIGWLNTIAFEQESATMALRTYMREIEFLLAKEKELQQSIRSLASAERYFSKMQLLTSVPSLGLISSMTLLTEIGDIKRFAKLEHLCSYCGLTPDCHSSGQAQRIGGMSRRGNHYIKSILIECAWMALRKDPALLLFYKQLLPRMNPNKAVVKVARKLLNRIRYVLINEREYVTGMVA